MKKIIGALRDTARGRWRKRRSRCTRDAMATATVCATRETPLTTTADVDTRRHACLTKIKRRSIKNETMAANARARYRIKDRFTSKITSAVAARETCTAAESYPRGRVPCNHPRGDGGLPMSALFRNTVCAMDTAVDAYRVLRQQGSTLAIFSEHHAIRCWARKCGCSCNMRGLLTDVCREKVIL